MSVFKISHAKSAKQMNQLLSSLETENRARSTSEFLKCEKCDCRLNSKLEEKVKGMRGLLLFLFPLCESPEKEACFAEHRERERERESWRVIVE